MVAFGVKMLPSLNYPVEVKECLHGENKKISCHVLSLPQSLSDDLLAHRKMDL